MIKNWRQFKVPYHHLQKEPIQLKTRTMHFNQNKKNNGNHNHKMKSSKVKSKDLKEVIESSIKLFDLQMN